jgi:hypothetical protein
MRCLFGVSGAVLLRATHEVQLESKPCVRVRLRQNKMVALKSEQISEV